MPGTAPAQGLYMKQSKHSLSYKKWAEQAVVEREKIILTCKLNKFDTEMGVEE